MSDIKLFNYTQGTVTELDPGTAPVERWLQALIETNMDTCLGVRFLSTEHSTGKNHRGRIDSLGIDENNCPVIVEYKRRTGENVINQGLFYLDWLLDHKADFKLLVMDRFGNEAAEAIDWSAPRLLCIASDFTRYDEYAVQQINRNIELIRYKLFGNDYLVLELVNAVTAETTRTTPATSNGDRRDNPHAHALQNASAELRQLYDEVSDYLESLGDDVQKKELRYYTAFKRIKNFASIVIRYGASSACLLLFLKLNPAEMTIEEGFMRDVTNIGHHGTGNLELSIRSLDDFTKAKPYIEQSYAKS